MIAHRIRSVVFVLALTLFATGTCRAQMAPLPEASSAPAMSLADVPLSLAESSGRVPKLTVLDAAGTPIHIMPTVQVAAVRAQAGLEAHPDGTSANGNLTGPLLYHAGGAVMPSMTIYQILWVPKHLQNGNPTGISDAYQNVQNEFGLWFVGSRLLNIATQYYQIINGHKTYIANKADSGSLGGLGGLYIDRTDYPLSACSDEATPGNCLSASQITAEIRKVMGLRGWTGGMGHVFVLYTSSGEGSCIASNNCAYTQYCAYHGYFNAGNTPVLYANIPYGNPQTCKSSAQTIPNDLYADIAVNSASHELMEVATDPLFNAWFSSAGTGGEIGQLCNFNFGHNAYDHGKANQDFTVSFELQQEWNNRVNGCAQFGP